MIRAPGIFRSVTFWSGILVMVFICWAWRDSTQRSRWLMKAPWFLESFGSGIALEHDTGRDVVGRSPDWQVGQEGNGDLPEYYGELVKMRLGRPFFARPLDQSERHEWFNSGDRLPNGSRKQFREVAELVHLGKSLRPDRDPMEVRYYLEFWSRGAPEDWNFFCPYWLILLSFALPWSGLLYGRHRRIRSAAMLKPPPP